MNNADLCFRRTRLTLLATSLLNEPLIALYASLPFILRKDLGATPLQVSLLIMSRPIVSLFSFYWGTFSKNLKTNLVVSGLLARLPFLCFFWMDNIWFVILCSALYMLFSRAGIPPWMEILKRNMPQEKQQKLFSLSSALGFAEGVVLTLGVGTLIDTEKEAWKALFLFGALLGILGVYLQRKLPVKQVRQEKSIEREEGTLLKPWKESLQLVRERPDFALFQLGFMIGGFGIVLIASVLPFFFADTLHLSHLNFGAARWLCMGIGFVLSSPFFGQALSRQTIASLTGLIYLGFAIFPLLLLLAPWHLSFLYCAYIIYGIAQGGSHIVWHLSGPIFAGSANSSRFSNMNILTVGIRGLFAPILGGYCCSLFGPEPILLLGALLCFCGASVTWAKKRVISPHAQAD